MSGAFSSPKTPKIPEVEEVEDVQVVEEDAGDAQRRQKKKIATGGRQSTVLSGIQSALKKRLGS